MIRVSQNLYPRKRQGSLFIYLIKAICLIAFLPNSASAAVWLFDPTVILSQGSEDNFRLSKDSSNEDKIRTSKISGELALKGKSEQLDVKALLRLDAIKYSGDDRDLNDKNNQLIGLSSRYRATERNVFNLKGNFFRDTILRSAQISLNPQDIGDDISFDPDQDVDVNLVQDNVRRSRFSIKPGWSYRFSENTTLGLNYVYKEISFSGGSSGTGLVESDRQTVVGSIQRRVTEKDKVAVRIGESYFRPDNIGNDQDVDTLEARLEWIHDFSETFQMDFSLGARDSEFENSVESSDTGFVANIGATKGTGLTTYRVNLDRRVSPSASGNEVEVDELSIAISRAITGKLTFNFDGRFFDTESTDNSSSSSRSDREYISLAPGLAWRFLPSWVANASYTYTEEDLDNGGSGDNNGAFISISYSPPRQF